MAETNLLVRESAQQFRMNGVLNVRVLAEVRIENVIHVFGVRLRREQVRREWVRP
jgi:hypothetical protein